MKKVDNFSERNIFISEELYDSDDSSGINMHTKHIKGEKLSNFEMSENGFGPK
jgi:hypothetical protein